METPQLGPPKMAKNGIFTNYIPFLSITYLQTPFLAAAAPLWRGRALGCGAAVRLLLLRVGVAVCAYCTDDPHII